MENSMIINDMQIERQQADIATVEEYIGKYDELSVLLDAIIGGIQEVMHSNNDDTYQMNEWLCDIVAMKEKDEGLLESMQEELAKMVSQRLL